MRRHFWTCVALIGQLVFTCAQAAEPVSSEPSEPDSPRLRALSAALDANDANALASFWKELDTSHSPLIEPLAEHPHDALYTFVWKADPDQTALNVQFNDWLPMHAKEGWDSFKRLKESNVWYTTYTLSRSIHIRYELIAPKGFHPAADRVNAVTVDGKEYETFHDPLNPRVLEWNGTTTSYTEGPAAKTSLYLAKQSTVTAGTMEPLDIESKILGNKRTLNIYLPAGYQNSSRDYGLLLVYDGNQYIYSSQTPTILDNMIAAKSLAPVMAVFLESPDRDHEFPPNDEFQKFVSQELVPTLRKRYRISKDPRRNAVLGASYGGIAATYSAFLHPEIFGNVLSQSGSFWWGRTAAAPGSAEAMMNCCWLSRHLAESPRKPIRLYLDIGLFEGEGMVVTNRINASILKGKGYEVEYLEDGGTHSPYYWMLRLPDALAFLSKTH